MGTKGVPKQSTEREQQKEPRAREIEPTVMNKAGFSRRNGSINNYWLYWL